MEEPPNALHMELQVTEMKMSVIKPEIPLLNGYPAEVAETPEAAKFVTGKERCN